MGMIVALAACTATAPATCADEDFDRPPALTCDAAIGAARERLASVRGVTELRFGHDHCAPGDRCPFIPGEVGGVTATLADGDQLYVYVRIGPEGVVEADAPVEIDTGPAGAADG